MRRRMLKAAARAGVMGAGLGADFCTFLGFCAEFCTGGLGRRGLEFGGLGTGLGGNTMLLVCLDYLCK